MHIQAIDQPTDELKYHLRIKGKSSIVDEQLLWQKGKQLTKTYMCCLNSILTVEAGNSCNTSYVTKDCVDAMDEIPAQNHENWTEKP
jgi:hypothetical protein